ncbi:MAG: GMC family oxidoreductase [Kangiellaceae bacterium]|nr:GMC family oxidoreductase [Kangiellaceae bacterium]
MSSTNPNSINANRVKQTVLETDVLIIGSGAGGGVSAEILAKAGFDVLIVEEGPHKTARDFKMLEKQAYPDLYQEAAGRKTLDKGINILQGRSVGGSTTVNWTTSFRTPNNTLQHWQKEWGLERHNEQALTPWFLQMEQSLNIEPWAIPANRNNQLIEQGCADLGWQTKVISRNVKACANLGYCGMGCPLNAKQSMLVTTIPSALKLGATLLHRARVNKLLIDGDKVTGCEVSPMDEQGQLVANKTIKVNAKHTILSAGAIGSPAVLLRSNAPDPYQLVGKRTFLHPVVISAGVMNEKVEGYSGAPQSIYSDHFLWPKTQEIGYKIEAAPLHPLLVSTVLTSFGQQHFELMQKLPYLQGSLALLRDGFHEQSIGGQVILDKYGYPKLDYKITDYLWDGARKAISSMTEMLFAAGAKQVMPLHLEARPYANWKQAKKAIDELPMKVLKMQVMSAHVMGGCTMGSDEHFSLVDDTGKYRHLDNLYVFDGSVFPTSIGANPQLSIYGLVARLASELTNKL